MILGCLLDSPAHGYEIRRRFKTFYNQSHGLNEGQLYTTVKKIENEGLVTRELVHQENNPPRKVLRLTEKGRQEFNSWLLGEDDQDPVAFDFFHVFSFLQKCNYFMHLPKKTVLEMVTRQIDREAARATEFNRVREGMTARGVNHYRLRIIEFGISFQEMKIEWLNHLLEEAGRNDNTSGELNAD